MIKVLTFGVFDLLHYGHINLFRRAKQYGDTLIVAVQNDSDAILNKPGLKLKDNLETRINNVKKSCYVFEVKQYSQIDIDIKKIDFDILIVGEDQKNEHFLRAFEWCATNNKEIITLCRTKNISSTILRNQIF